MTLEEYKNLAHRLNIAASKWDSDNPHPLTFDLRYGDAIREASNAIMYLVEYIENNFSTSDEARTLDELLGDKEITKYSEADTQLKLYNIMRIIEKELNEIREKETNLISHMQSLNCSLWSNENFLTKTVIIDHDIDAENRRLKESLEEKKQEYDWLREEYIATIRLMRSFRTDILAVPEFNADDITDSDIVKASSDCIDDIRKKLNYYKENLNNFQKRYNTLLDENMTTHLALGNSYNLGIK